MVLVCSYCNVRGMMSDVSFPGIPYWGPGLVSSLEALGRLLGPFLDTPR